MNRRLQREAQRLQAKLAEAQEALGNETVEATSGGGVVRVVVDGHQRVRSIHIEPEAIDPDERELLEDLVLAAMNEGLDKSRELAARRLGDIAGGLGIPGLI